MLSYTPPLRDMQFVLHELLCVETALRALPAYPDIDREFIDQVIEEGGKFCSDILAPLNAVGDVEGCHLNKTTHEVTTPKGFREAYDAYVKAGWPSISCSTEFGGQGLPYVLEVAFQEMTNSSNQAWAMYPGLTHGAYNALRAHGTEQQKKMILPHLVSGEWGGTMCLTEPHCGTDLGLLRTRAEPLGNNTYKITGNKIFISSGEHDLTKNIVHLVLARLPDAPPGIRGISLFLVSKLKLSDKGELTEEKNGVTCGAIEHKMGIHGNATCQINLDGAIGTLVGQPHKGMQAMFVMMNEARLGVGIQSLGVMSMAYQSAVTYARERIQMRSLSGPKSKDTPADPIIVHPDVRRMLLTQRAWLEGARAFVYWAGLLVDHTREGNPPEVRKESEYMLALLTPIVKGFLSDIGYESANLGMQVYGGHGYITETGMEQLVRDARITMIYEGTNGIQALDLLGRKVLGDGGERLQQFAKYIEGFLAKSAGIEGMEEFAKPLQALGKQVEDISFWIGGQSMESQDEVGAAAHDYLRILGHLVFAWLWAWMASIALSKSAKDPWYQTKLQTARFYFARLLPETAMCLQRIKSGRKVLLDTPAEAF